MQAFREQIVPFSAVFFGGGSVMERDFVCIADEFNAAAVEVIGPA